MKKAIQPGADVTRNDIAQKAAAGTARSWHPQQPTIPPDGQLTQLAAMMNGSPRAQALAQPNNAIQHSPRVQNLMSLATEINQNAPVQRVRILLKDVDKVLMGRLRLVPVANAGAQTLQDPAQVGTLNEIGANEAIVLEGHGHENAPLIGSPRVVSQAGIAPAQLAALVRDVPKPDNWAGNVVLLGCSTGSITAAVSQEYFKLTRKTVNVIGTRTNIRVGTKEDGSNFIGSDWSREPADQRPADLAFVDDLVTANKEFIAAVQQLAPVYRALDSHVKGVPMAIPHPVNQIEARGLYIIDVESLSDHKGTALPNRRYAKPSRIEMSRLFREVFSAIYKVAFFRPPSTVNPIVDALAARTQVDDVLDVLRTLSVEGMRLYTEVDYELHAYKLKEIDLTSNVSAQHSKRRRTAESIFGDTWVDEP
jgi:hypothetical protein